MLSFFIKVIDLGLQLCKNVLHRRYVSVGDFCEIFQNIL